MHTKYFGTDGIRGEVNTFLTPEVSFKLGLSLAHFYLNKQTCEKTENNERLKVFIGSDPRFSCDMLVASLSSGLMAGGLDVVYGGIVPSAAVSYITNKYSFICGVMVTASHNGLEFNGLKVFTGTGAKISVNEEKQLEKLMHTKLSLAKSENIGHYEINKKLKNSYVNFLNNNFAYKFYNKRIVIGAAYGAGSSVIKSIFTKEKFINTTLLAADEDGEKINSAGGAVNAKDISKAVVDTKSDYGFAVDGDADRVVVILQDGRELTGDELIFLLATLKKSEGSLKGNKVVATLVSNTGLELALNKNKIKLYKTGIGDKYVIQKLLKINCSLGGERSGHIIVPELLKTGDGILNIIILLNYLETFETEYVNKVLKNIRLFNYIEKKVTVNNLYKAKIKKNQKLQKAVYQAETIIAQTGRVIIRPSGTEPIIRVIVEGLDEKINEKVAASLVKFIEDDSKLN